MTEDEQHDRVLVAYGSKHGATTEIAEAIGRTLKRAGFDVDVEQARRVHSLAPYRAVVLGSAVYAGRWRGEALRLLAREDLHDRDVWLFSSGPVGEDKGEPAERERWLKPPHVEHRAHEIGARAHVVFGGCVATNAGFMRAKMARGMAPELRDRRDWNEIEAWANAIAAQLHRQAAVKRSVAVKV